MTEFLRDCMDFLLKEIRIAVHVIPNGPLVYKVPHDCNKVNRRSSLSSNTSQPYYITLAERVIMDNGRSSRDWDRNGPTLVSLVYT